MEYKHRKPQRKPSLPLIIGRKPVLEALEQGTSIEKIFLLRSAVGPEISAIKKIANQNNVAISLVPQEKLDRITKVPNQGVIAWGSLLQYFELQDAIDFVVNKGETPLFLLLDGITDVRNVGAIARTAYCMGAQAIIFPSSNAASLTEEAIKTSAGALRKILLSRVVSAQQAIDVLKLNGIKILATHLKGAVNIKTCDLTAPTAIVMGSEESGISAQTIKRADELVFIPMPVEFDSLNVSVAAGMILYEAAQQRLN